MQVDGEKSTFDEIESPEPLSFIETRIVVWKCNTVSLVAVGLLRKGLNSRESRDISQKRQLSILHGNKGSRLPRSEWTTDIEWLQELGRWS